MKIFADIKDGISVKSLKKFYAGKRSTDLF